MLVLEALENRASAELDTTPDAGSCRISITGPLSRSATLFGTPAAGVRFPAFAAAAGCGAAAAAAAAGCAGARTGPDAPAAHSLLHTPSTLPSRTTTAGARSGSTGLPQIGQAVMAGPKPHLRRGRRRAHRDNA